MSGLITGELAFLGKSFLLGIILGLVYEIPRTWRFLVPHCPFWIGLEDILFWILTAFVLFAMALGGNDGKIRWYSFAAEAAGACVYFFYLHRLLVWICRPVWIPAKFIIHFVENRLKKIKKIVTLKGKKARKSRRSKRKGDAYGSIQKKKEKKESVWSAGNHLCRHRPGSGPSVSDQTAGKKE